MIRSCAALFALASLACDPSATIGRYSDAGARCDPAAGACASGGACLLASDPQDDACKPAGAIPIGAACPAIDSCVAGAQCASISGTDAMLGAGECLRVCPRDATTCRCAGVRTQGGGVRVDYGVCAP